MNSIKNYILSHKIISAIVAIVLVIVAFNVFGSKTSTYQFMQVKRGNISQEVDVTGRVTPIKDLSLGFQASGRVAQVNYVVGDRVSAGAPVVVLDQSDFLAQLAQAKANAAAEQANLDALRAGTRSEQIKIDETAVAQAQQALNNSYSDVNPTLEGAYITANDAIRKQMADFFSQAETASPQLTFSTNDGQAQIDAQTKRYVSGLELNTWRKELDSIYATTSSNTGSDSALTSAYAHLGVLRDFLSRTNDALTGILNISATTISTYRAEITNAQTQVTTAMTNITNLSQTLKNNKLSLESSQNSLALAVAGSTKEQVASQQARVDSANASVANIQAQLEKTVIRAPINGIVTRQDAKIGQIVSPNVSLVGLISEGVYEIDANIPEVDVGKMAVGNPTSITLDALQGDTFMGKVIMIDPAETIVDGAVNFKVKILFDKVDPRVKSGFTANLGIITQTKENALILPQFAILQNDQGIYVRKQISKDVTQDIPVVLGVRSKDGNVEIVSGINEGDSVANIGLKSATP